MATDLTVSWAALLAADDTTVSWEGGWGGGGGWWREGWGVGEQRHQLAPHAGTRSSHWDSAGIHMSGLTVSPLKPST